MATTILILIGLAGLSTLIHENAHMTKEVRRLHWATCALVAGVTVAELGEVTLEQMALAGSIPWLFARWVDHVFTPAIGIALIRQIGVKNRWNRLLGATCAANAIWQTLILVSGALAWVTNTPYDHLHSAPHAVYVTVYVTSLAVTLVQFLTYGSSFKKQNRTSLYLAITATICGLLMQELTDNQVRTTCLGLMTSLLLLFAHNESFHQNVQADTIRTQRHELMYDPLTCILNRYAYEEATRRLKGQRLPDDFVVFSIDINGLKGTNDTYGHDAGDTLIQGAAACIRRTFKDAGEYYRTGGDEFVVFATMSYADAQKTLAALLQTDIDRAGLDVDTGLSAGYAHAAKHEGAGIDELIRRSDKAMYNAKKAYYEKGSRERRRS